MVPMPDASKEMAGPPQAFGEPVAIHEPPISSAPGQPLDAVTLTVFTDVAARVKSNWWVVCPPAMTAVWDVRPLIRTVTVVGPSAFTDTLTGPNAAVQSATAREQSGGGVTAVRALPSSYWAAEAGVEVVGRLVGVGAALAAKDVAAEVVGVATLDELLAAAGPAVGREVGAGLERSAPPAAKTATEPPTTKAAVFRLLMRAHPIRPRIQATTPKQKPTKPMNTKAPPTRPPVPRTCRHNCRAMEGP